MSILSLWYQHIGPKIPMALLACWILPSTIWSCSCHAVNESSSVDIRGTITTVTVANPNIKGNGVLGFIMVEGTQEPTTHFDKASIRITNNSKIERCRDSSPTSATFDALVKGSKVEFVFSGPVAQSYPVQATAQSVLSLDDH